MYLVISSIKRGRFCRNLVLYISFPNKFAAESCKRFPPHLNSVFTLPCETWYVQCARAAIELLKNLHNLSHLNWCLKICHIWIQFITACGKYCKRRCTKHNSNWNWERSSCPSWITSSFGAAKPLYYNLEFSFVCTCFFSYQYLDIICVNINFLVVSS